MEFFGWVGGFLLSVCGVPQAWKSYKDGNSKGISWSFIWMWFIGEIFLLIYVLPQLLYPLIINYLFNIFIASIILWYKFFPRNT